MRRKEDTPAMNILPLASDSLGVRSLSAYVWCDGGTSLLIDGGARLGPKRFGLPPSALELRTLERYRSLMEHGLNMADAVTISHYHYDHYLPASMGYEGKVVYVKDPENDVNRSQEVRGKLFTELQRDRAVVRVSDGRSFVHDDMALSFSEPLPHGEEGTPLGYVIMTRVTDVVTGEILLHTSDVQGPVSIRTAERIMEIDPDFLILDGAPTYLREWQDPQLLETVGRNLAAIVDSVKGTIIMDHHLTRDGEWESRFRDARSKGRILTYAEYHGMRPQMLESLRRELWRSEHGKD